MIHDWQRLKGRVVGMEKVKVTRYMTGKRPDWAPEEFDSDEELQLQTKKITIKKPGNLDIEKVSKCVSPSKQLIERPVLGKD